MRSRFPLVRRVDPFLIAIVTTVGLAAILPADGDVLDGFTWASRIAIGVLFFLYGARLSTRDALDGFRHWRLQAAILATTFVVFPLLGLAAKALVPWLLTDPLYLGVLYLCLLPSTVQSAIALVSVARGNIPGAIVGASVSSLLGILVTPLLVTLTMAAQGASSGADAVREIVLMLLLPFLVGQIVRRGRLGSWVALHGSRLAPLDRGAILLVVYVAFSRGMNEGIWSNLSVVRLAALVAVCLTLLSVILAITWYAAPLLGFGDEDRATLLFCGSTKSLATGLPMAMVLFPGQPVGLIVLPLMVFHQVQLLVCAVIATRLRDRHS